MKNLLLDIQRAFLLLRTAVKFGASPLLIWILRRPQSTMDLGVRLRLALEELGITYLKAGQYLAMRYDVIPAEICRELNRLFEKVSPLTFDQVTATIEAELGAPFGQFFSFINPNPVGSASVAQVHEARIVSGDRVAVKIQRPGVERIFAADIRNLRRMASLADISGVLGRLSALEMVDAFAAWTFRELNFVIEGRTADRLRVGALPHEIVPRVFWDLTTPKLLTMEFIEGTSLSHIADLLDEGGSKLVQALFPHIDVDRTLHQFATSSLSQLFVFGFFHGDPHPGNLLATPDDRLAFVDFGIFGTLTVYQREVVAGFIRNIAMGNIGESFRYFSQQFAPTDDTDLRAFQSESFSGLRRWYQASINPNSPMRDRHLGQYVGLMLSIARRNRLRMGASYLLFWRVLNALDTTVLRLSPQFDILGEMRTFFEQIEPDFIQRILDLTLDTNRAVIVTGLVQELPRSARRILRDVRSRVAEWPVIEHESTGTRQAHNRDTAWLTIGLVMVSISVLVASTSVPGSVRLALIIAAIVLSGVVIWQTRSVD